MLLMSVHVASVEPSDDVLGIMSNTPSVGQVGGVGQIFVTFTIAPGVTSVLCGLEGRPEFDCFDQGVLHIKYSRTPKFRSESVY